MPGRMEARKLEAVGGGEEVGESLRNWKEISLKERTIFEKTYLILKTVLLQNGP